MYLGAFFGLDRAQNTISLGCLVLTWQPNRRNDQWLRNCQCIVYERKTTGRARS